MQDILITDLKPVHLAQAEDWASRNAAVKTLMKSSEISSAAISDTHSWVALHGEEAVAIVTVKLNKEHVGYINCVVKPTFKRKGIGTNIMKYAMKQPFVTNLVHLHAAIDPNNIPALKVLDSLGFSRSGYNEDGYIELARHKHK
jgi:RimJ/RimL family protein N-acetyltransferase